MTAAREELKPPIDRGELIALLEDLASVNLSRPAVERQARRMAGDLIARGLTFAAPSPPVADSAWRAIESAPRDGSPFWGEDDGDATKMFWHEEFGEFISSFRRMTMAPGYTVDDKPFKDHSPVIHHPKFWMPFLALPADVKERT